MIDDLLPAATLRSLLDEFPEPTDPSWVERTGFGWQDPASRQQFGAPRSLAKLEVGGASLLPPVARQVIAELNSSSFVGFLEDLTGISGLIPDPHLMGAGLHSIGRGGMLRVHADFVWHQRLSLHRRVNLLLYLNEDWREEYGGQLELWDEDMVAPQASVLPIANRCVIFNTTSTSYHGHPRPVRAPRDVRRQSVALYYYTAADSGENEDWHKGETLWQASVEERRRERSGLRRFVPPIVVDTYRYCRWRLDPGRVLPPVIYDRLRR